MSVNNSHYTWPSFILFGDSISQVSFSSDGCWGAMIADHLQRKCDVSNRGFSGYNSRWCKLMLPQLVTAEMSKNIAGITLFLGANDSNDGNLNPRQHVPLTEFKQNMLDMVQHLQSVGIKREQVIIISPPAYNVDAWAIECKNKGKPVSKTSETTAEYAKSCIDVAKEMGIWSVDLYTEMLKDENWKDLLNDGLHLSASGSKLLFNLLQPIIDKITCDITFMFALYDEVDYNNPAASLQPHLKI